MCKEVEIDIETINYFRNFLKFWAYGEPVIFPKDLSHLQLIVEKWKK